MITPEGWQRFDTAQFLLLDPHSSDPDAYPGVDIHFITPGDRPNYATYFGPQGLAQLYASIHGALKRRARLPVLPQVPGMDLSGQLRNPKQPVLHFGELYDGEVLQALGLLTVRANLLDSLLVDLLTAVSGMSAAKARQLYYSTQNMKAKLDQIRSLVAAESDPVLATQANNALDQVKAAADRRNDLVHAEWSFRNGKHRATIYRPNAAKAERRKVELTVSARFVEHVAEAYQLAAVGVLSVNQALEAARLTASTASTTASTPSFTDPSKA